MMTPPRTRQANAALSAAAAAITIGPLNTAPGRILSVLAALMALLSYGRKNTWMRNST